MSNQHPINVINYFLEVLRFNDYHLLPNDKDEYMELYESEVLKGIIREDYRNKGKNDKNEKMPYDKFSVTNVNNGEGSDNKSQKEINVILMTKLLDDVIIDNSGLGESSPVCFFYIRAKLTVENKLVLPDDKENALCWSSHFDSPLDVNGCSFNVNKDFNDIRNYKDWNEFINYVKAAYTNRYRQKWNSDFITDKNNKDRQFHKFTKEWIIIKDETVIANKAIVDLLYRMKNQYESPILFDNIINNYCDKEYRNIDIGINIKRHIGQMKSTFPMADNQRTALHAFQDLKEGNVLAVSGPPGTGKTTMLQTVVADYIVRCAYIKKAAPIILISSSNNKAITNVIDSFNIKKDEDNQLFNRWIEYNKKPLPLAVYMASASAKSKSVSKTAIGDLPFYSNGQCEEDYTILKSSVDDIEKFYKKCASKSGYIFHDVEELKQQLWCDLKETVNKINSIDNEISNNKERKSFIKEFFNKFLRTSQKSTIDFLYEKSLEYTTEKEGLKKVLNSIKHEEISHAIDKLLDPSLRYKAFWLAVHYYEACWLLEIAQNKQGKTKNEKLKELALVCPCTIATFFKAPHIYTEKKGDGIVNTLYSFVDLLIVDEAGQVCPEIGLPTFAFAKKAIVMGDIKQIPPVYSISDYSVDIKLKQKHGLNADSLFSASYSCLMKIAADRSQVNDSDEAIRKLVGGGFMLNEHYRCFDEIIAYCNKLMYSNKLTPKKGLKSEKKTSQEDPFPAMSVITVDCKNSEIPSSGSRKNKEEALSIVNWITTNINSFKNIYKGKELKDILCVISPFKAQADEIQSLLKKTKNKELEGISVGTVHTFQGAECPIVCFSTTYGSTENFGFLHSKEVGMPILNVAVSRAKEHFVLFTSKAKEDVSPQNDNYTGKAKHNQEPEELLIEMCENQSFNSDIWNNKDIHEYTDI